MDDRPRGLPSNVDTSGGKSREGREQDHERHEAARPRPPKMPEQVVQERLDIQPCEIASAKREKEGQSPSLGRHRQGTDRRDPVLFVEKVNDGRRSFEALAASACAVLWKKITDRYCVPTSGPCRFSWVGSW